MLIYFILNYVIEMASLHKPRYVNTSLKSVEPPLPSYSYSLTLFNSIPISFKILYIHFSQVCGFFLWVTSPVFYLPGHSGMFHPPLLKRVKPSRP